jgi:hypothetical protein
LISSVLTNVPSSTANLLSYTMLVVVAVFLVSGPVITYYYWRKSRRMKAVSPAATP